MSLLTVVACSGSSPSTTGAGDTGDAGGTGSSDAGATGTPGADAGGGTPSGSDAGGGTVSDAGAGGTNITGTLGSLGPVKPIVASLVLSNSGETLIYLSSAPLSCTTTQTSRWLGSQPAGSQVIEIVMKGKPAAGQTVAIPPGEANYAAGGKSSSYETSADSGTLTFTRVDASGAVGGTVSAKYADGSSITGTFNAESCANGQQY